MTFVSLPDFEVAKTWAGKVRAALRRPKVSGRVLAGAAAGLLALVTGVTLASLSTGQSDAAIEQHRAYLIAQEAKGDFSEARLQAILASIDPGVAAVGARLDPTRFEATASVVPPDAMGSDMMRILPGLSAQQAQAVNAGFGFSDAPNPPARPFFLKGASAQDRDRALGCMTQAVYYEAGFEPLEGAQAVAQVVINRVRHPAFPKTVCGVVYEGSTLSTGCQFSFTCDGSLARPPAEAAWKRARDVAQKALNGFVMAKVGGATHYHTDWIVPYWAPTLTKVQQVGTQIFYRWPGAWGLPDAFRGRYAGGENPGVDVGGDPLAAPGAPLQAAARPIAPVVEVAAVSPPVAAARIEVAAAATPVTDLTTDAPNIGPLQLPPERPQVAQRLAFSTLH